MPIHRAVLLLVPALLLLAGTLPAQEQPAGKPDAEKKAQGGNVVITNASVAGHEGLVTILVAGGKVRAVGPDLRAPRGAVRLDAAGAQVRPGRIDAWAGVRGADALGRGADAWNRYDAHAIEEALRNGVTTLCLTPGLGGGSGVLGVASVVKVRPGAPLADVVIVEEAAVVATLGAVDAGPIARANAWGDLREAFNGARRYRDALADYDEALEKYLEEAGIAAVDTQSGVAPVATPTRAGAPATPPPAHAADDPPPRPRGRRGGRPGPAPGPAPSAAEGEKKDEKKAEKPKRPGTDRAAALLVRVLEGELPLRVQANRAEDLVCALELQRELGVRLIIEGGLEAHLVADLLAAGPDGARVVLGDPLPPGDGSARPPRFAPGVAAALHRRAVPFALGTGDLDASRFVELVAALAASQGLDHAAAEEAITSRAAEVLGLGERLGKVAPGYDADLVLLARAPLGTAPAAEVVLVDGHVVWRRSP
jgi:imidazolonepropionase-like amidohydrolase